MKVVNLIVLNCKDCSPFSTHNYFAVSDGFLVVIVEVTFIGQRPKDAVEHSIIQ